MISHNKAEHDDHADTPDLAGGRVEIYLRLGTPPDADLTLRRQATAERLQQEGTAGSCKVYRFILYYGELAVFRFKGELCSVIDEACAAEKDKEAPVAAAEIPA